MWQQLKKPQRLQGYVRMAYSSQQLPEYRKMKQNTGLRFSSMHEMLLVIFKVGLWKERLAWASTSQRWKLHPVGLRSIHRLLWVNLAQAHPEHQGL